MSNIKTPYANKRRPPIVVGVKLVTCEAVGKIHQIVGTKAKQFLETRTLERKELLAKARTGDNGAIARLKTEYGLTIVPIAGYSNMK